MIQWRERMKRSYFGLIGLIFVVLCGVIVAQQLGLIPVFRNNSNVSYSSINVNATAVVFSPLELQTWNSLKDRLTVYNADPNFTGERTLQWISMRNSSSGDYYQNQWCIFAFGKVVVLTVNGKLS